MNNTLKTLLAVTGGVAVGLVAGILTAPKSGKETRKDIKDGLGDLKSKAGEIVNNSKEHIKEAVEEVEKATTNSGKNGEKAKERTA